MAGDRNFTLEPGPFLELFSGIMRIFYFRLMIVLLLSTGPARGSDERAIRVSVKGLVCSFCARGINDLLAKQPNVARFEIHVSTGELLIWSKSFLSRPTEDQIRNWVEKGGLQVKEIASPSE